ncbi:hypothetical protein [Polyangium aurulentum]|uniref:hypothetical protein n=1 Tax=Polyangium aurulentum TaxID=2567896 RepID=UPI0010AE72C8|nr:hypothetical protein [Polyangium aurulentum]UQA60891.1 hypothetical protein E8A73_010575 [Polyangium aurulentum]
MSRISRTLAGLLLGTLVTLAAPASTALARTPTAVDWTRVDAPPGDDADRLAKNLKGALKDASRKADFGKTRKVALRARITEYVVEKRGDVLRIRVAVVGRIVGGPSAKSRISFGGDPRDPKGLEKQVLTMVANGVVSRLAALVRDQEAAKKRAEEDGE